MTEDLWWHDHSNVCGLARYLKDEGHWDGKGGVGNLIYFFEKPWKYWCEWGEYQKSLRGEKNAKATR